VGSRRTRHGRHGNTGKQQRRRVQFAENTLACAAWLRSEDFTGAGNGVRRENGGRSWVVDELRIVDQGENLREGGKARVLAFWMWK
jgi:hypothetical protein